MIRIITIMFLLLMITSDAMADGKMYGAGKIPPTLPQQRALILFKNGVETIVLQSKYEIPPTASTQSLGWVVPVPVPPEIAGMPADQAANLFYWLNRDSRMKEIHISDLILQGIITILVLSIISFIVPIPEKFKIGRRKLIQFLVLVLCISSVLIAYRQLSSTSSPRVAEVLSEQHVGIYDVRVVKSTTSDDLIKWLNKNEFKFTPEDIKAFESYIAKGWCFVTAMINPASENSNNEIARKGLTAQLILRFPQQMPTYPVALTGTGNYKTELLIYLATDSKMSCNDRLKLQFAGAMLNANRAIRDLVSSSGVRPVNFFKKSDVSFPYLCKFKETLTSDDMKQDIVFTPSKDSSNYREYHVSW